MNVIEARFQIVTPMFIAGADQSKAELRAPSIKGALRFWWRALQWKNYGALEELRAEEARIFGDAGDAGQSRILIRLKNSPGGNTLSGDSLLSANDGRKYLGYGLFSMGDHRQRYAIPDDKNFDLDFVLRPKKGGTVNEALSEQLKKSIRAMGLLGGLGSRSRNGFGAIAIEKLDGTAVTFSSLSSYKEAIERTLDMGGALATRPLFSAVSQQSRLVVGELKNTAEAAHQYIGNLYRKFRTERQHERRKRYFGLPLDGYDIENRRASPLFFHVHPVAGRYAPVAFFLASDFHPDHQYQSPDYSLIEEFMDFFEGEK